MLLFCSTVQHLKIMSCRDPNGFPINHFSNRPHKVQSHGCALLPLKCYLQLNFAGCPRVLDRSVNSILFSLCPDYSDRGGVGGAGAPVQTEKNMQRWYKDARNLLTITANVLHQGHNSHFWKWADRMNQVCSFFLHLHGWHVISSEQTSERWGINDDVTEMRSGPICCNTAMFYMLFRTLTACHRLIIRKLAAGFFSSRRAQKKKKKKCVKSTNEFWLPLPVWRSITLDIQSHTFHRLLAILFCFVFWLHSL